MWVSERERERKRMRKREREKEREIKKRERERKREKERERERENGKDEVGGLYFHYQVKQSLLYGNPEWRNKIFFKKKGGGVGMEPYR